MRALLALVVVLGVAGCTDTDWEQLVSFSDAAEASPEASEADSVPAPVAPLNPQCQAAAEERASDVALQGFGVDMQRTVYNRAYADCAAWSARGRILR